MSDLVRSVQRKCSEAHRKVKRTFHSGKITITARVKCVCPVAQSAAVELVVFNDRSLIVHSHRTILLGESVGCVVVGSERGAEYTGR